MRTLTRESERRKLNVDFDRKPSPTHRFNFALSLPYISKKRVLDVGCWSGQFERLAVYHAKHIVGIDPGIEAVKYAQKQIPKAVFKVGRGEKLSFPESSFDTVIFCDVLEHIPKFSEKTCLKEILRVLRPSGHLILSTPNSHVLSILLDPAYFLIGHRHYSQKSLNDLLNKAGFKVIFQTQTGGLFTLFWSNLEILFKHFFKRKIKAPKTITKQIFNELYKGGFAENYAICKKTKSLKYTYQNQ